MNYGCLPSPVHALLRRVSVALHADVSRRLAAHYEGRVSLPSSVDLDSCAPGRVDQGATSCCTAASTTIALYTAGAAQGKPIGFVPSQRELYAATRALEGSWQGANELADGGAMLSDVMTVLARYGVRPNDSGIFDVTAANVTAQPDLAGLEQAGQKTIVGPYGVDPKAPNLSDTLAAALASGIPVETAFGVDDAFEHLQSGQVAGAPSGAILGGHAVFLSGYELRSDGTRAFWLTNSWGGGWCDRGRCLVGDAWLAAAWEFWPLVIQ